jgi:hypothetical protein
MRRCSMTSITRYCSACGRVGRHVSQCLVCSPASAAIGLHIGICNVQCFSLSRGTCRCGCCIIEHNCMWNTTCKPNEGPGPSWGCVAQASVIHHEGRGACILNNEPTCCNTNHSHKSQVCTETKSAKNCKTCTRANRHSLPISCACHMVHNL